MPFQTLPRSTDRYSRAQRREIAAAVAAVRRVWRQMSDDFDASWLRIGPVVTAIAEAAQLRVATGAAEYIPVVLSETGQPTATHGTPRPASLVGVAGDGRPVGSLLYGGVVQARTALAGGATHSQALAVGSQWLTMATGSLLSDTGRGAELVSMATHQATGYVRMLVPPSCSRCAIMAGRYFRLNQGFQRHPGCDCRHVPASEALAGEMTVDTRAYFDSLTTAEQNRIFTNAGAEAIRNGADIGQVVNARRYMHVAQSGRIARNPDLGNAFTTTSRRRGPASGRRNESQRVRLMPESILEQSRGNPDIYLALLRIHGWII